MKVSLEAATVDDATEIHRMQVACFRPLLDKYQDYDLSPAAEALSAVENRCRQADSDYYFIMLDAANVGAVRVVTLTVESKCRVSPIFVLPEFQGKGIAQAAFAELERLHAPAQGWILQTIAEETGNCYLYEKLGYHRCGAPKEIRPGMHLVSYVKED